LVADLHQVCAALAHHFRNAEATADLHRLPTRDDDIMTPAQGSEAERTAAALLLTASAG
jgi:hypothetical protein